MSRLIWRFHCHNIKSFGKCSNPQTYSIKIALQCRLKHSTIFSSKWKLFAAFIVDAGFFFLIIFYCYTNIFQPNCIFHITIFFCCYLLLLVWIKSNGHKFTCKAYTALWFNSLTHDVVSVTIKSLYIRILDWKIAVTVNGRKYNDLPNIACIWMRVFVEIISHPQR